jgi:hypothetical protein
MPASKTAKHRNKHRGSSLRGLLKEDGILEEVEAAALKRALAAKAGFEQSCEIPRAKT